MAQILFLTQILPYPLNSGAKVRAYHMLRHLARENQVTLVSFTRPDDEPSSITHLRGFCSEVHCVPMQRSLGRNIVAVVKGLASGVPIVIARDWIRAMAQTVQRLTRANSYSIIHADQLSMSWYGRFAVQASTHSCPRTVLDEHNAVYLLTRRMVETETSPLRRAIMAREARAFAHYEATMCRFYDAVLTVTQEDRDRLLELFEPGTDLEKFTVVPISVDPSKVNVVPRQPTGKPTIVHVGTMFWPPNIDGVLWFAREVLPIVQQQIPEVRFVIVGKRPPPEVQNLASDPHIKVTGYVADLMPYLAESDVFVVPLRSGGGMRVKILDAWLWGLPIVSTSIGAEGIETSHGSNILIADDTESFAQETLRLLKDRSMNDQMRKSGRQWVETKYKWQNVYHQVDHVYNRLLSTSEQHSESNP